MSYSAEYYREYRKKNREQIKVRQQKWRAANRPKILASQNRWAVENRERVLFNNARNSAKRRGLVFAIKVSDISIPTRCPVLGIPLAATRGKRRPDSPSLDRMDNTKGYLPDNIVVVSWKANDLKSYGTPEDHRAIADFYGKKI